MDNKNRFFQHGARCKAGTEFALHLRTEPAPLAVDILANDSSTISNFAELADMHYPELFNGV